MFRLYGIAAVAALGLGAAGLSAGAYGQDTQPAGPQMSSAAPQQLGSVYDDLMADPRFGTTMKMVYMAGGANRLAEAGPLTVFAATDDGWSRGDYGGYMSSLSSTGAVSAFPDSTEIVETLRGFFVHGEPTLGQANDVTMRSSAGRPIEFDRRTMTVKWVAPDGATHEAKVAGEPIRASNGVIYPVDAVVGS
jgi:uncharacterized surface protein with fasciclin (FAS1) repeats